MRLICSRAAAVSLVVTAICASSAAAQFSFQVNRITDINVETEGVQVLAVGDFTNDNRDDIIAVDNFDDRFCLYVNDGSGNFTTPPIVFGTGSGPVAATVGDFNNDGKLDVAIANEDADTVTAYLGDGTGNFINPVDFDTDPGPVALVAVDLNNDRLADLAVLTQETVYLLRSTATSESTTPSFVPFNPASARTRGDGSASIAHGLFNNDTNQDLAVTLQDSSQVAVFLGGGDGTFQTAQLQNVGPGPLGIVVAELRTRGTFDIAVVDSDQDADLNVSLLFGDGAGGFQPDARTTAEVSSLGISAGDFDGDGPVDLAVTNISGGQSVALLQNNPDAPMSENGFVFSSAVGVGQGASAIRTANLNGDGLPDLVVLGLDDGGSPSVIGALVNRSGQTPSPTTPAMTPGTATPTPPATATFTPIGPSPTPTPTSTLTASPTPTPIPTVPYTLCNTNQPGQPEIGGKPVSVATGRLTNETPFIVVADNTGNKLVILAANINQSGADACALLGLVRLPDVPGVTAPRAVISQTVDLNGNSLPLDLDRDGKTDLAVVGSGGLSLFFGDGKGGFTPGSSNPLMAGVGPLSLGSTDYNRDGLPDLVVASGGTNDVSIFLGTGTRSLQAACPVTVGRHTNLIFGEDLNRDGRPDFAAGSDQTNDISIFLQTVPTGTPTPITGCTQLSTAFGGQTPLDLAATPSGMVVDIFEFTDRVPDLAVTLAPLNSDGSVQVFYGRSTGTQLVYQREELVTVPRPTPTPPTPTGPSMPSALGSADVNSDGRNDLIITDRMNGTLVIFLAQSNGRFVQSLVPLRVETTPGATAPLPAALAVASQPDIDGDGKPDIVVANEGDGSISVFVSARQPFTPTPLPTNSPTETGTPTITPTETLTPSPTPEDTASPSPTASFTPTRTRSPSPLPSATPKPGTFNLSSCAIVPAANGSLLEPMAVAGLLGLGRWLLVARRRRFGQH